MENFFINTELSMEERKDLAQFKKVKPFFDSFELTPGIPEALVTITHNIAQNDKITLHKALMFLTLELLAKLSKYALSLCVEKDTEFILSVTATRRLAKKNVEDSLKWEDIWHFICSIIEKVSTSPDVEIDLFLRLSNMIKDALILDKEKNTIREYADMIVLIYKNLRTIIRQFFKLRIVRAAKNVKMIPAPIRMKMVQQSIADIAYGEYSFFFLLELTLFFVFLSYLN
jgi:hypothetical protein